MYHIDIKGFSKLRIAATIHMELVKIFPRDIMQNLTFLFIVLIPFGDSSLQNSPLGFLGASLGFIPLILSVFLIFINILLKKRFIANKYIIFSIGYIILVTAINFLFLQIESHGVNIVSKSINMFVLTVFFMIPLLILDYRDKNTIRNALMFSYLLVLLGLLLVDILNISFFNHPSFFHSNVNAQMRPRSFSYESSVVGAMIVTIGFCLLHYIKDSFLLRAAILLSIIISLIYINSKGSIIVLAFASVLAILLNRKTNLIKKIAIGFIASLIGYLGVINIALPAIIVDINNYTSFASRSTLNISAILIFLHNPFGVGFGGLLQNLNTYIPEAAFILDNITGLNLNYNEVLAYVNASSDDAITIKSFFFSYLAYFGLPFMLAFFLLVFKITKKIKEHFYLSIAFIFSVVALLTFSDAVGMYHFSLVFGIALSNIKNR